MTAPSSYEIARAFNPPAGNVTSVTINNAQGHLGITDYATARFRAGYIVGNFLPYGFIGMAVGRGNYSESITVDVMCSTNGGVTSSECQGYPLTPSAGQSNALLYGYSVGAGLDWAMTQHVFLRGEFEFIQFASVANIAAYIMNARAGVGFKF
jgi:outer membrane immunogenic protein